MEQEAINKLYGNQIRVRVCGICIENDKILLIKHTGLGNGYLWAPPGGGLKFGEALHACLIREFLEETGLTITVEKFLFLNEFIQPPLHAVELFYAVKIVGGNLKLGSDPEMAVDKQILTDIRFFSWNEIKQEDSNKMHALFQKYQELEEIFLY